MKKIYSLLFAFCSLLAASAQSDEPCTATALTVGTTCTASPTACINPPAYTNSTSASSGVTLPALTCNGFTTTTFDLWYKATVPASGKLNITLSDAGTGAQVSAFWDMALYTSSNAAACAGSTFTQIGSECSAATYPNVTVTQPAGTVVFIRIWREAASAQTANRCFTICALDPPAPPTSCATINTPANSATGIEAPKTLFSWSAVPGATSYDIYFGTTTTPTLIGNTANNSVYITSLTYATQYYWYVVPKNAGGSVSGCNVNSTFTTKANPGVPANDDCAGAISIAAYTSVNGTTQSATQSQAADATCAGTSNDDVWFKFTTVQAGDAAITVTPSNSTGFDGVIVAYSGTCGSLVRISCEDANGTAGAETITLTGLTAATTYYLRVYDWNAAGSEGTFTVTATGSALPVQIAEFTGIQEGGKNLLKWRTSTESNNKGFELQRSADGRNYSTITTIASKAENGNSNVPLSYSYLDVRPLSNANYYRLKQIDNDGRFSLSDIVLLKSKLSNVTLSSVYPNPAKIEVSVIISSPSIEKITLVVTDLMGKVVSQSPSINLVQGDNLQQLDIRNLAAGSYLVKVICANGCETAVQRFVKQ
jgi:hypothetical protein